MPGADGCFIEKAIPISVSRKCYCIPCFYLDERLHSSSIDSNFFLLDDEHCPEDKTYQHVEGGLEL